jgi:Helix-turn-helix domain
VTSPAAKDEAARREFKRIKAWRMALNASKQWSAIEKVVGGVLSEHHNNRTGRCDPAYSTIAKESTLTERSVIRIIQRFEAAGWLAVRRTAGGRWGNTNNFVFLPPPIQPPTGDTESPRTGDTKSPVKGGTGDTANRERVTQKAGTGDRAVSPKPEENQKKEGTRESARARATLPPTPVFFGNGNGQAASEASEPEAALDGEIIPPGANGAEPEIMPPKGNGRAAPARRAAGGTRIDPLWEPSEDDWSFAAARGLDATAIDFEVQRFRNWYLAKPGAAGLSADWSATFRNFVLGWDGRHSKQKQTETREDQFADMIARAIEQEIATGVITLQGMADDNWGHLLHHFQRTGEWSDQYFGPRPGQPGCAAPDRWLERYGFIRGPPR